MTKIHLPAPESSPRRHNRSPICKLRRVVALPEESVLRVGEEVPGVQSRVDHLIDFIIVRTLFDDENREARVSFGQSTGDYAAGETTWKSCQSRCMYNVFFGKK
jgi:hypothetical protein